LKAKKPYEPLLFAALILIGVAAGFFANKWFSGNVIGDQTKLEQIMSIVESQYVDSLDQDEIQETAIHKYLSSFDPHSVYIPSRYVEMANQELKGGFDGIGLEFFVLNDTPYVVRVLDNGPALKAGISAGDRLLWSDTTSLLGMQNREIIQQLKGPKHSKLKLTIYRKSIDSMIVKELQRAQIKQESVRSTMLPGPTAYFKILHFAEPTHQEFTDQFKALAKENTFDQVIVDLRDNPGGFLKTAIDLLDEFIDSRDLLTYTKGKSQNQKRFSATPGGLCSEVKLICLVNENSASASEIFSGAIQDLDRGLVMGNRTFGKGLVQETFQLRDGSQIRLTVSRYYIPSGRSIQKPYDEQGYTEEDGADNSGNEMFKTKNGRKVLAKGGVAPDIILNPLKKQHFTHSTSLLTANILDELGKIQTTAHEKIAVWFAIPEVQRSINNASDEEIVRLEIRKRLIYQLWGPQAVMEDMTSSDAWLLDCLESFPQVDSLLNP
jgi:carboxyl-terminal processing protease